MNKEEVIRQVRLHYNVFDKGIVGLIHDSEFNKRFDSMVKAAKLFFYISQKEKLVNSGFLTPEQKYQLKKLKDLIPLLNSIKPIEIDSYLAEDCNNLPIMEDEIETIYTEYEDDDD